MQKTVLEMLKRGIILILHFGRQSISPPPPPPQINVSNYALNNFKSYPVQKRVLEVLKTWYFPYSAFWLAGQWGGYTPPPRPPWLRYCPQLACCVLGPWPRAFLCLVSSIPVLGLERVCPRKVGPWFWPQPFCSRLNLLW